MELTYIPWADNFEHLLVRESWSISGFDHIGFLQHFVELDAKLYGAANLLRHRTKSFLGSHRGFIISRVLYSRSSLTHHCTVVGARTGMCIHVHKDTVLFSGVFDNIE